MTLLSVIIPAYNEDRTISEILRKVREVNLEKEGVKTEIIVVSDGSTDRTVEFAKRFKGVQVINLSENMGKGAAVRRGFKCAQGDMIIIQDADLEYNPQDYKQVIAPILAGNAKVVYGSRVLRNSPFPKNRFFGLKYGFLEVSSSFGARLITKFTNLLFGTSLTDEPTCYKCFSSDVIKNFDIDNDCFAWEPEITAKIAKKGIKIHEVPISYKRRSYEEGKKMKISDGIYALWTLVKYRFNN